jgi:hypothetical protein
MEPGGWIFMLGSWLAILGLFAYCLVRTLRGKDSETGPS